jgi:hypothetical protein
MLVKLYLWIKLHPYLIKPTAPIAISSPLTAISYPTVPFSRVPFNVIGNVTAGEIKARPGITYNLFSIFLTLSKISGKSLAF